MSRKALFRLLVVAIAVTLFSLALSRRDSADWRSLQARRLFPFPWQSVSTLVLDYPNGERREFSRDKTGLWRVQTAGDGWDLMNFQAQEELAALVMLPWRDPVKDQTPPDPESAPRLTAVTTDGVKVEIAFGPVVGNLRILRIQDDPAVAFGINPDLARIVDWPPERFRNLYLAAVPPGWKSERIVIAPASPGPAAPIELKREADGWNISGKFPWPAEPARLDMLFNWLGRLEAETIVAEQADDPAWFGLDDHSASVECHYETPSGAERRRIEFGRQVPDQPDLVYARVLERTPIFAVSRSFLEEIVLEHANSHPREWAVFFRKRSFSLLGAKPPGKIGVEKLLPVPERLVVEKTAPPSDLWQGVLETDGGEDRFAVDPPHGGGKPSPLERLLSGLANVRIRVFLADGEPGQDTLRWTAYPAWRFTVFQDDGTPESELTLFAVDPEGSHSGDRKHRSELASRDPENPVNKLPAAAGIAAHISGMPAILEIDPQLSALLCLPPHRFHTTRMIDSDHEKWTRIVIRRDGEATAYTRGPREYGEHWWRSGDDPEPLLDDNNVFVAMLLELSKLRASEVVAPSSGAPEEFGLDRPTITAIVYGTSGEAEGDGETERRLFSLDIGAVDESGLYFSRINEGGMVFLLPGETTAKLKKDYR